jgi:hypothetical protein
VCASRRSPLPSPQPVPGPSLFIGHIQPWGKFDSFTKYSCCMLLITRVVQLWIVIPRQRPHIRMVTLIALILIPPTTICYPVPQSLPCLSFSVTCCRLIVLFFSS